MGALLLIFLPTAVVVVAWAPEHCTMHNSTNEGMRVACCT
jgi:hypothetical protein